MTRLIDANALKLEYPKDEDWEYYPVNTNSEVCETIDAMPTVEAIPIEWIKEVIHMAEKTGFTDYAYKLNVLLSDWAERKEE